MDQINRLRSASVTPDEGALLTLFFLTKDETIFPAAALRSFMARSLLSRNKKGELSLTDLAGPCLSFHPLLGAAPLPVSYPRALIPFLFSLLSRGKLSENPSQRTRYLNSELFSSFFPGFDKRIVTRAAVKLVNAFQQLGLVRSELGDLFLESSAAEDFTRLSEYMRLAHLLSPESGRRDAGKLATALFLYVRSEEDNDETRALIERISGSRLPDAETLSSLFLVPGARLEADSFEGAIVSSDFTMTFRGYPEEPVFLYAEPVKCDTADTWLITKQSVRAALSCGMSEEDILSSLSRLSVTPLPEAVTGRIQSWSESFSSLRCMRAVMLIADERNARILEALPMLKGEILSKPADNIFIMESSTEGHWRRILENSGLDMLAFPEGSSSGQRAPAPSFFQTISFPDLPQEREVPYDPLTREPEEGCAALEEAWKRSGLLIGEEDAVPAISPVLGLYYQEKQRLVKDTLSSESKLYAEMSDGTVFIARPEKTLDPDIIVLLGQEVRISEIWKCASVPDYIADTFRKAQDEDPQDTEGQ